MFWVNSIVERNTFFTIDYQLRFVSSWVRIWIIKGSGIDRTNCSAKVITHYTCRQCDSITTINIIGISKNVRDICTLWFTIGVTETVTHAEEQRIPEIGSRRSQDQRKYLVHGRALHLRENSEVFLVHSGSLWIVPNMKHPIHLLHTCGDQHCTVHCFL